MENLSKAVLLVFIISLPVIIPLYILIAVIRDTNSANNLVLLMREANISVPLILFIITIIFLFNYAFWTGFIGEESDQEKKEEQG